MLGSCEEWENQYTTPVTPSLPLSTRQPHHIYHVCVPLGLFIYLIYFSTQPPTIGLTFNSTQKEALRHDHKWKTSICFHQSVATWVRHVINPWVSCCRFRAWKLPSLSLYLFVLVLVDFSLQWLLSLQGRGCRCAGSSSCRAQAWLPQGVWDIPWPGFRPVSPALQSGFLTTGPTGTPCPHFSLKGWWASGKKGFKDTEAPAGPFSLQQSGLSGKWKESTAQNLFVPLLSFFFWPCSMWDLSSLTRDQTCAPCTAVLTTGPPGKSLTVPF